MNARLAMLGAVCVGSLAGNLLCWRAAKRAEAAQEAAVAPWRAEIRRLKAAIEEREARESMAAKAKHDSEFVETLRT